MNGEECGQLIAILEEIQNEDEIKSNKGENFLNKHPLFAMGNEAIVAWTVTGRGGWII